MLLLAAGTLVVVGWLAIARAEELLVDRGLARRQMIWSLAAAVALFVAAAPSYRRLTRWSYALFALALALLIAVFFAPPVNGAHRWLRMGVVGFQPSDLAKLAFVLAEARYLMYRENYRRLPGLLVPIALAAVPVLLVLKEPDLGTALVFLPVLAAMLLAAGARTADLAKLALVGLLLAPLLWSEMNREQRSRITALWCQSGPWERAADDDYQLHQAKQVFALGGAWGSLIGGEAATDRLAYHLPEAQTDFVFPIVGERFGLLGCLALLGLYALVVGCGMRIAQATREPFGRLVATGLSALLATQVLINTAMTVGLAPVTGLALPLVSYGGSGLVSCGLALGLLVNIACRPGYELAGEPFRYASFPRSLSRPPRRHVARQP